MFCLSSFQRKFKQFEYEDIKKRTNNSHQIMTIFYLNKILTRFKGKIEMIWIKYNIILKVSIEL
jgi:hypothetical protein